MSVLVSNRIESKFEAITYSEVDLNLYDLYVKAIDREIGLIKKWRQHKKEELWNLGFKL